MTDHIPVDPMSCVGSAVSEPYWLGLSEGRLMLPFCDSCGRTFFFPRRWCPRCWSAETSWVQATGRGTIYSACMVNIPFDGRSAEEIPYTVALIDLEEGVRLPGRLHHSSDARVGEAVAIHFADDPRSTLPVWASVDRQDG